MAAMNYEGTYRRLPAALSTSSRNPTSGLAATISDISVHARLLPFMEQTNIYNTINFNVGYSNAANDQARLTEVPAFRCPSDGSGNVPVTTGGANNFMFNSGTNILYTRTHSGVSSTPQLATLPAQNGVFYHDSYLKLAAVRDGLSNTVGVSERLTGDFDQTRVSPRSDTFQPGTQPFTVADAYNDCMAVNVNDITKQGFSDIGAPWIRGYHSTTTYYHVNTPNGRSCMFPSARIMTTASSNHTGGVNVSMLDGSTKFVSQTVDLTVWRGVGTREEGEVVDMSVFE